MSEGSLITSQFLQKWKLVRQIKNFVFSSLSTNKIAVNANLKINFALCIIKNWVTMSCHLEIKLFGAFNFIRNFALKMRTVNHSLIIKMT